MAASKLSRHFKKSSDTGSSGAGSSIVKQKPQTPANQSSLDYLYEPLDPSVDSIRLLKLQPPDSTYSEVRCTLVNVKFGQKPVYEALSYTWGDPKTKKNILLNGRKIEVGENLYSALLSLRKQSRERILWVDAICIDQSNLDERSYQVGLMDYIYTRASSVLIWLGQPVENHKKKRVLLHYGLGYEAFDMWLCDRDYWSRLWIIQEVGLARNLVVCMGRVCKDWDVFLRELSMRNTYQEHGALLRTLDERRKRRNEPSNQLHELLAAFQDAKCSEPRDKIYGFLGLAHDCQDRSLRADYTISLFELYEKTMMFFSHKYLAPAKSLTELEVCMQTLSVSELVLKLLGYPDCPPPEVYPPLDPTTSLPETPNASHALAAIVGKILHVGPTYDMLYASSSLYKEWKIEFERHGFSPEEVSSLREAYEAFDSWLSIPANQKTPKVFAIDPLFQCSRGIPTSIAWSNDPAKWQTTTQPSTSAHEYYTADLGIRPNDPEAQPRLFLASGSNMGLAPPQAKVGDVICQFWRTDIVALLRLDPRALPSEVYHVIGRVHLSTGYLDELKPIYPEWKMPPEETKTMLISMDIQTLSALSA